MFLGSWLVDSCCAQDQRSGEPGASFPVREQGVEFDPKYSAAWKLLGKAQAGSGDSAAARRAWEQGIEAAQAHGDKQAEKEMTVFLKKLDRLN